MLLTLAFTDRETQSKFMSIYSQYNRLLYAVIKNILQNDESIRDCLQETYIRIFQKIDKIPDSSPKETRAYIVTIAKGLAIDFYRKEKIKADVTFSMFDTVYNIEDEEPIDKAILSLEFNEKLEGVLKQLSFQDRQIIILKYYYDKNHKEIEKEMGWTEENTRQRLHRARKKLSKIISEGKEDYFNGF